MCKSNTACCFLRYRTFSERSMKKIKCNTWSFCPDSEKYMWCFVISRAAHYTCATYLSSNQALLTHENNPFFGYMHWLWFRRPHVYCCCCCFLQRKDNLPHRASYVFIQAPGGESATNPDLWVQKRTMIKDYCPGYLDPSTGELIAVKFSKHFIWRSAKVYRGRRGFGPWFMTARGYLTWGTLQIIEDPSHTFVERPILEYEHTNHSPRFSPTVL